MKIGVIGLGSIGRRHVNNLQQLGYNNIFVYDPLINDSGSGIRVVKSPDSFLEKDFELVLLCAPTHLHFKYLMPLLENNQNLLVEKPLVSNILETNAILKLIQRYSGIGIVGYNMRFHPCVLEAISLLSDGWIGKPYSARFFVGQYLPDWRPNLDYSESYSAKKNMGGGVALDLIHEVDLAVHLLGIPDKKIMFLSGKISSLKIETEDVVEILYQTQDSTFVSIHLDYVFRGYKRYFEIIGEKGTLHSDLYKSEVVIKSDNNKIVYQKAFPRFERNDMYLSLIKHLLNCIKNQNIPDPSLIQGIEAMKIVCVVKE